MELTIVFGKKMMNKEKEHLIDIIREITGLTFCRGKDHVKDKMKLISMYIEGDEYLGENEKLELYTLVQSIGKLKGVYGSKKKRN